MGPEEESVLAAETSLQLPAAAAQEAAEGLPEGHVAQSVAAGVEGAVDVTQPVPHRPQNAGDDDVPEGGDDGQDVVGRPSDDEGQEDGQDGPGDPPLPGYRPPLASFLGLEAGAGGQDAGGGPAEDGVGRRVIFDPAVVFLPRGWGTGPRTGPLSRATDICGTCGDPPILRNAVIRLAQTEL